MRIPSIRRFHNLVNHIERVGHKNRLMPYDRVRESTAIFIVHRLSPDHPLESEGMIEEALRAVEIRRPNWFRRDPSHEISADPSVLVEGVRVTPPNPFASGNLTEAQRLRKDRPDLALRLEIEALAESGGYSAMAERDPLALLSDRQRRAVLTYDGANPFVTGAKWSPQAQRAMTDLPALESILKAEAEIVNDCTGETAPHGNPWRIDTRNVTRQGAIVRHDPELAAVLEAEAKEEQAVREKEAVAANRAAADYKKKAVEAAARVRGLS